MHACTHLISHRYPRYDIPCLIFVSAHSYYLLPRTQTLHRPHLRGHVSAGVDVVRQGRDSDRESLLNLLQHLSVRF